MKLLGICFIISPYVIYFYVIVIHVYLILGSLLGGWEIRVFISGGAGKEFGVICLNLCKSYHIGGLMRVCGVGWGLGWLPDVGIAYFIND